MHTSLNGFVARLNEEMDWINFDDAMFDYMEFVQKNKKDRLSPEYELLDTGIFKNDRYFDCYIE